jgi:hypothetical protein
MLNTIKAAAGRLGGLAGSKRLTPEQKRQRAQRAAESRWKNRSKQIKPEQPHEPEPEGNSQPEPTKAYTGEVEQQPAQYYKPAGPSEPGWSPPLLTEARRSRIDRQDARLRGGLGWAEAY